MRLSIEIMNTAIQQARYVQSGFLIPRFSIPGPAQMVPAGSGTALMWRWNRRLLWASPTTPAQGAPGVADHVLTSGHGSLSLAALPRRANSMNVAFYRIYPLKRHLHRNGLTSHASFGPLVPIS